MAKKYYDKLSADEWKSVWSRAMSECSGEDRSGIKKMAQNIEGSVSNVGPDMSLSILGAIALKMAELEEEATKE